LHPYASKGQAAAQKAERGRDDELNMAEKNNASHTRKSSKRNERILSREK
jgi:hypothetical protein